MKVFIPIACLMALAIAEPPVGDGYAAARSSHDDYHDQQPSDHQRSLSQEYGPPSDSFGSARNAPSDGYEYNSPNARTSLNAHGRSQFAPAKVRVSFNQNFGRAASRSSAQDHSPGARGLSQGYPASARNGISQEYGAPSSRSSAPSQEYGVPSSSARTLSTEYGVPNARSSPSEEYGAPAIVRSNQNHQSPSSNFRSAQSSSSENHSAPSARSQFQTDSSSRGFSASSARSNDLGHGNDVPKSFFGQSNTRSSSSYDASSRSLSSSYDAPSARNFNQDHDSQSRNFDAHSHSDVSQNNAVTSTRMTDAVPSSFASARSSPSSTYLPASRNAAPLEQYGVPEQRDTSSQGYDDARARALEELQNQEPASYDFGYQIEDQESGSDFGHTETREENRAQGSYFVVRPDGSKQTVDYEADERGFKPRISVQPAGGYDDNAQDAAARTADGPY